MIGPEDFKQIADEIIKKIGSEEPAIRTSIGRKYYYLFLELRETIKVNVDKELRQNLDETSTKTESIHCILREFLFALASNNNISGDKKILFKKASNSFKNLRKLRNESDYKLNYDVDMNFLKKSDEYLKEVEKILPEIKNIGRTILNQCLEVAIAKCNNK